MTIQHYIEQAKLGKTVTISDSDMPEGYTGSHPQGSGRIVVVGCGVEGLPCVPGASDSLHRLWVAAMERVERDRDRRIHEATHCRANSIRWA